MPSVLIIRGYCGTGKSSIARELVKKHRFAFLEYDTFLWGINASKKPGKADYEVTYKNFLDVLKNYLHTKRDVLVEGPLVPRTKDDPFHIKKVISTIRQSKHKMRVVQLTADEKTCVRRMKKRNHIVPKWERDMFKQKHDLSTLEEEIVIDTSDLTIKQTINKIEKIL